ncbi:hypothetical protein [Lacunimicrobium album]
MDQEFLVDNQIDAGQLVIHEFQARGFIVDVAFWLRELDSDDWYLYISSDRVADEQPEAYEAIVAIFNSHPELSRKMDLFRIRLIDGDDERTRIASRISLTRSNTHAHYVNEFTYRLGGTIAYFYPPLSEFNRTRLFEKVHGARIN